VRRKNVLVGGHGSTTWVVMFLVALHFLHEVADPARPDSAKAEEAGFQ